MNHITDPLDASALAEEMFTVNLTPERIARYWAKVPLLDPDDCWLWPGGFTRHGYGQIRIQNRKYHASRIFFFLTFGSFPKKFGVLHKCDNPPCCNPLHLFLGTQADNMRDMDLKGRRKRGSFDYKRTSGPNSVHSKLTLEQVQEIRRRRADGEKLRVLGDEFGVCEATICLIAKGINWSRY